MKIIFAQGNPGGTYTYTRHNIGFLCVDALTKNYGASFVRKAKFSADIAETTIHNEKVLFVKPITFYNETGSSARQLIDFYKVDPSSDFLVVHDDLALPFGTIRTREKGRDAGNNGIKSLNAHLGANYSRIRIGIYNDLRDHTFDTDFVLAKFNTDEKSALPAIFSEVERFVDHFIEGVFESTKLTIDM